MKRALRSGNGVSKSGRKDWSERGVECMDDCRSERERECQCERGDV